MSSIAPRFVASRNCWKIVRKTLNKKGHAVLETLVDNIESRNMAYATLGFLLFDAQN